jgi:hypothetical protein
MKVKTERARRVLNDTKAALNKFNNNPIDIEFRHLVVLCSVLIRAVGHALKTENETSNESASNSTSYFKKNIEQEILFKSFIHPIRNSVIKEYSASLGWASITTLDNNHRMEYLFKDGINEGKDFRDLMNESIVFWEYHLNKLEENYE